MRNGFRGYYPPSRDEMKDIWDRGLIILDTNALLHLFRYSKNAREDFFKALEAKRSALWLPHQVGAEFHRRRIDIINAQNRAFGEIEEALNKASGQVKSAFDAYKRHPSLNISPLSKEFSEAIQTLQEKLSAEKQQHTTQMIESKINDVILSKITDLYENRVGAPYSEQSLTEIYEEGAKRYESKIPPGYEDGKKAEPARYGDLVLWKQILAFVSDVRLPAIFVTDDRKEDWWYIVDSHRHGTRPELVDEFYNASSERIHLMTSDRFLDFAKTQMVDIRSESVDEAERLSRDFAHVRNWDAVSRDAIQFLENDRSSDELMRVAEQVADRDIHVRQDSDFQSAVNYMDYFITQRDKARRELDAAIAHMNSDDSPLSAQDEVFAAATRLEDIEKDLRHAQSHLQMTIERLDKRGNQDQIHRRASRVTPRESALFRLGQTDREGRHIPELFDDDEISQFETRSTSKSSRSNELRTRLFGQD